jgi:CelD/BcsL family acetyltransferase involved in cellulose biosynthesis
MERARNATPVHNPAWSRTIAECYGFRGFGLAIAGPDGDLTAGVPVIEVRSPLRSTRWISLPFTDECGPVAVDRAGERELIDLLDKARRTAGVASYEIRTRIGTSTSPPRALTHRLALSQDLAGIERRYRPSVRQGIRVAARECVTVRRGEEMSDLTDTYYTLHVATRRRLGIPVQPRRFFELLWKRVVGSGHGFVLIAERDRVPLSAAVFLCWNRQMSYKYGASDPRFWRLRANAALFHHAIARGCQQDFVSFDWGRTDFSDEGLQRFKRSWGSQEFELVYTTLGEIRNGAGRLVAPTRAVIRRSPRLVCRVAGALLYRYAA